VRACADLISLQYLTDLKNWSIPIVNIEQWVKQQKSKQASATAARLNDASASSLPVVQSNQLVHGDRFIIPLNPTNESIGFCRQLALLNTGKTHTQTSDLHKVYANLDFVAAAIGLSSNPAWQKIENVDGLKALMTKYVVHLCILSSRINAIAQIRNSCHGSIIFQSVREEGLLQRNQAIVSTCGCRFPAAPPVAEENLWKEDSS
jgi:ethanolamine ammonia-lyase large subunit